LLIKNAWRGFTGQPVLAGADRLNDFAGYTPYVIMHRIIPPTIVMFVMKLIK
jgi:hypothetical protein